MQPPSDSKSLVAVSHPIAFWFFFWGEFAERCSFYGMRAILPLYLVNGLGFADSSAVTVYFAFKMATYGLPLLGGYLADRWFGKYWTIVGFSVPYVLGHFILGFEHYIAVIPALILLACGSGVIKPNISTLMGDTYDQQRAGQLQLRSAAFMWFDFAVNIGALVSTLALPTLRDRYGYSVAFQFPAWLMLASLLIFASGKPFYALKSPRRHNASTVIAGQREQIPRSLLGVFGLMVLFWVPYEHNDSIWVLFARDYVNLSIPMLSRTLAPDQLQFLSPLCVLIFVPLFGWLFRKLDPSGKVFTVKNKILAGFVIAAISSGLMTIAGFQAGGPASISVYWLASAYVLLTMAEVLVYGTGLELAYAAAPASKKSFVTGSFLLTTTLGNFINFGFTRLYGGSLVGDSNVTGLLTPGWFFLVAGSFNVVAALGMSLISQASLTQAKSSPVEDLADTNESAVG